MKNFGLLLNNVVVKKAYGYKYHSFYTHCKPLTVSKEVTKADICVANSLLNNMILETEEDFALALSALNMLGAGAKQQKAKEEVKSDKNPIYAQRRFHLYNIIQSAINKNIDIKFNNIIVDKVVTNKKGEEIIVKDNITIVKFHNLQFSYHVDSSSIIDYCEENNIDIIDKNLEWNPNFKMQNGGKELFEFCVHLNNTSNTISRERPLDYVKYLQRCYYIDESKIEEDFNITLDKFVAEDYIKNIEELTQKEEYGKEI